MKINSFFLLLLLILFMPIQPTLGASKAEQLRKRVEKALEILTVEERAQIDLIVLESGDPAHRPLPVARGWFVVSGKGDEWWFSEQIQKFPVKEIRLTSYGERFPQFISKKRTEPTAIKGEKLYLRNCVACHEQQLKTAVEEIDLAKHPAVQGLNFGKIADKNTRAIRSYLKSLYPFSGISAPEVPQRK